MLAPHYCRINADSDHAAPVLASMCAMKLAACCCTGRTAWSVRGGGAWSGARRRRAPSALRMAAVGRRARWAPDGV